MRIVIALASSSGQLSGVQRHGINLARCLLTRDEITQVHLVAAPWQIEFVLDLMSDSVLGRDARLHLHAAPIGNNARSRNLWFYRQLPELATQLAADIVHLAYPVPVRRDAIPCPSVVTLHDLYPYDIPENFGFPKVLFNRAVLRQCLREVDSIACVSESTRSRLAELHPQLAMKKSTLIYNSVEPCLEQHQSPPEKLYGKSFLLCVAQHRRNKNVMLALRVFKRLIQLAGDVSAANALRLVIVGIPGPETPALMRYIARSGLTDSVTLLNGISDQQLQWCYSNCRLLFAPSSIEGFGLPVAEALLAGCRVVCSDIPAFRELGGNHCHYVSLGTRPEEAFVDAIAPLLNLDRPRPVALPRLSMPVIADAYVQLYSSLLSAQDTANGRNASPLISAKEGGLIL